MPQSAKKYAGKRTTAKVAKAESVESMRGTANERGYNARWQRARLQFLNEYPLCQVCEPMGHIEEATIVDHVRPHRGNPQLFWDVTNWQALCETCHNRKTGKGQ